LLTLPLETMSKAELQAELAAIAQR
jgi:hypothetical protein